MQNRRMPSKRDELEYQFSINEHIKAKMVRLVGDNIPNPGIVPIQEALRIAQEMELDLIEISPTAQPPVCKILDFQKFLYQQKKKQKEIKAKTAKVIVKEIRFGPNTDDHDYNFKLKHAINFLQEGNKVKAFVFFRGRSILYADQGKDLLERFIKDLENYGKIEQEPKLEGKRMIIIINPLPKKKS